jgi:hypothetical protein
MESYFLKFTRQDLEILNQALLEAPMPYKYTSQLISNINKQIAQQDQNKEKEQ